MYIYIKKEHLIKCNKDKWLQDEHGNQWKLKKGVYKKQKPTSTENMQDLKKQLELITKQVQNLTKKRSRTKSCIDDDEESEYQPPKKKIKLNITF